MVTKSVAACILSGALASVLLPDGRLVVPAYAAGRVVEKAAKVARTADTSVTASVPTPHERKECLPSGKRALAARSLNAITRGAFSRSDSASQRPRTSGTRMTRR